MSKDSYESGILREDKQAKLDALAWNCRKFTAALREIKRAIKTKPIVHDVSKEVDNTYMHVQNMKNIISVLEKE